MSFASLRSMCSVIFIFFVYIFVRFDGAALGIVSADTASHVVYTKPVGEENCDDVDADDEASGDDDDDDYVSDFQGVPVPKIKLAGGAAQ